MNQDAPETTSPLALPHAAKPVIERLRRLLSTGCASEALPCLAELDDFERYNPTVVNLTKGTFLIDIADDLKDTHCARRGVSLIRGVDVAKLPESARADYWYNLGHGHGSLYYLKKIPSGARRVLDEDLEGAKQCYQKAMTLGATSPESVARLYTNYGILLRTVGRHIEEIEAYDAALRAVPDFAMALWHKARGLGWYSKLVERPAKRSALLEARLLLKKSLKAGLEPTRRAKAEKDLAELERILRGAETTAHRHTKHIAHSRIERKYIKFCLANLLYLHPCPVSSHEAYQDPLSVRFPTAVKGEYLELRLNSLARLKQEYIAARFLLFLSRSETPDLSFVERGTFLPSVESSEGQIYLQMLNLSFRAAYGILDKIAYFLDHFCKLRHQADSIYFAKRLFFSKGVLRPELSRYDGPQLAALVDLAGEFSKGEPLASLRELRNKLEHTCLTVRKRQDASTGIHTGLADAAPKVAGDEVTEEDLQEATLRLFRVVRAAIFYLFWFVRRSVKPPNPSSTG